MGGLMWVGKWWKLNQPWTIRGSAGEGGWVVRRKPSPGTCKMAAQIEMLPMPQWVIFISIFTVFPPIPLV